METSKVVFGVTVAQVATLRGIRKKADADLFKRARRDPRWSLVKKGLLERTPGNYGSRFTLTTFGGALLAALEDVKV